jgi:IS5 family transposase
MNKILPWEGIIEEVNPYCTGMERAYPCKHLEMMLRIFFLQDWLGWSDDDMEDALHENMSIRSFIGIGLELYSAPDAIAIAAFREGLERQGLADPLIALVNRHLIVNRYFLRRGTLLSPVVARVDDNLGHLRKLSSYFNSIQPPYGLREISQFNAIYKQIYTHLNPAEKHRAEKFVEAMLEGIESPDYASKIFGVV